MMWGHAIAPGNKLNLWFSRESTRQYCTIKIDKNFIILVTLKLLLPIVNECYCYDKI